MTGSRKKEPTSVGSCCQCRVIPTDESEFIVFFRPVERSLTHLVFFSCPTELCKPTGLAIFKTFLLLYLYCPADAARHTGFFSRFTSQHEWPELLKDGGVTEVIQPGEACSCIVRVWRSMPQPPALFNQGGPRLSRLSNGFAFTKVQTEYHPYRNA